MNIGSIRIPQKIMGKKLGSEWVLLNLDNGVYYGLNETGSVIWDELAAGTNGWESVVGRLEGMYEADRSELEKDVREFLRHLHKERLIELEGPLPED
ncbi:MAG: PqqD family protein [Candidatus Omnitrophica bacterium]|nr:PqqD family protein [Candidatus Omnitrophota bacterium]